MEEVDCSYRQGLKVIADVTSETSFDKLIEDVYAVEFDIAPDADNRQGRRARVTKKRRVLRPLSDSARISESRRTLPPLTG